MCQYEHLKHGSEVLASDFEEGLVRVDLLVLHQEPHVAGGGVIEGQLQAVVHARTVGNLNRIIAQS